MNDVPAPLVSKGPYANETWPQVEKDFATAVMELDARVGMVMNAIKTNGLDASTIVFL